MHNKDKWWSMDGYLSRVLDSYHRHWRVRVCTFSLLPIFYLFFGVGGVFFLLITGTFAKHHGKMPPPPPLLLLPLALGQSQRGKRASWNLIDSYLTWVTTRQGGVSLGSVDSYASCHVTPVAVPLHVHALMFCVFSCTSWPTISHCHVHKRIASIAGMGNGCKSWLFISYKRSTGVTAWFYNQHTHGNAYLTIKELCVGVGLPLWCECIFVYFSSLLSSMQMQMQMHLQLQNSP